MKGLLLLLSALTTDISPVPSSSVPAGTIMSINATTCMQQEDMDRIIDMALSGGNAQMVSDSIGTCDNMCITGIFLDEPRQFRMQDGTLYGEFEVMGFGTPNLWATTQIETTGWPIGIKPGMTAAPC